MTSEWGISLVKDPKLSINIPFHEKCWLNLPGGGFDEFGCCFSPWPRHRAITAQPTSLSAGWESPQHPKSAARSLMGQGWAWARQQELHKLRSYISSLFIRTWNNRWGKFRTKGYYVLAFISVHWLSLCCFMCAMKGQIKTHFSFMSILFLFFNYLSSYCIAATDGTLKMNSLFGNCMLCSLFLPSKMTM